MRKKEEMGSEGFVENINFYYIFHKLPALTKERFYFKDAYVRWILELRLLGIKSFNRHLETNGFS